MDFVGTTARRKTGRQLPDFPPKRNKPKVLPQIPTKIKPSPSLPPTPARTKPIAPARRSGSLEAEPKDSYNEDYNYAYMSNDNLTQTQIPLLDQKPVEDARIRRQNSMKIRQSSYQDDYYFESEEKDIRSSEPALNR